MLFYVIIGLGTLAGWMLSSRLKSKFKKYSTVPIRSGKSGAEVAQDMLDHFGVRDVKIVEGRGFLSDHYNPLKKTIALSPNVYRGRNVSAAAVAAHECGHAVQHKEAYQMLKVRSALVPAVQASSRIQQLLFIGLIFGMVAGTGAFGSLILLALVVTFGLTALFALVTLYFWLWLLLLV